MIYYKFYYLFKLTNSKGQIGDGKSGIYTVLPTVVKLDVLSGKSILQLAAGNYHTCIISNDEKIFCWGGNKLIILF
jgi:alpha-tubulin suppressor-like RCC1 family protein